MISWFLKRCYPESIMRIELEKIKFRQRSVGRREGTAKEVSLVLTYHPLLKSVGAIIHKHLYLLHMDKEVKRVLTTAPIICFKSSQKLRKYLVRATF